MTTRLLVPIRGADPRRRPSPEAGLDGVVPVVEDGALLAFSGVETVRRWRPVARFVTVTSDQSVELARRFGAREVVRDVAGPVRTRTSVEGAAQVAAGPFDLRGLATPLAPASVDGLRALLAGHPAVEEAWVVEATVDAMSVVVAAFSTEPGHDEVVRALASEVVPLLPVDLYAGVQVVVVSDDDAGRAIRAADDPLYVRR